MSAANWGEVSLKNAIRISILTLFCSILVSAASAQINFPDGSTQTTAPPERHNVVHVAGGGTDTANGTALRNAIANITDATTTNQYTIQLDSAVYNVGGTTLQMKPSVHIKGVTQKSSRITGSASITIAGADEASLHNLRVTSTTNGSTLYLASGIFAELFEVDFQIPVLTGNQTGVRCTSAGDIILYRCRIGSFQDLNNGTGRSICVHATGADTFVEMVDCIAGLTELNAGGEVIGVLVENGADVWVDQCELDVEPENGSTGTCLKVTTNGLLSIHHSVIEATNGGDALSTTAPVKVDGSFTDFTGAVTTAYFNNLSDFVGYVQSVNNFTEL